MNKTAAKEWLRKVYHDLKSAQILYEANHFTDSIGVDLHYAIEKSFKTFLAYQNKKIPKTHNLLELNELNSNFLFLQTEEIRLLHISNRYHIEATYPQYDRAMPPREEIKEVLEFAEELFNEVCKILSIDKSEVMK